MSAIAPQHGSASLVDPLLSNDLIAHLDAQIASAARLLEIVMAQEASIHERDVDGVVRQVAAFQAEFERRTRLESDRARLLSRAAVALRLSPEEVTVSRMAKLMAPADARVATTRSTELQSLLAELSTRHAANQALIRQELAFLDHLLSMIDPAPALSYQQSPTANVMPSAASPTHRAFDLHA
jgi:hypothetical protein